MSPPRLFFVCGPPKSGTTWLQLLLDAHPQIACAGEGQFIENLAQPFELLLRQYAQKADVIARNVYGGHPSYQPLTNEDAIEATRMLLLFLMRRTNPPPATLWHGDKTPAYARHLDVLDRLFPDCRFIEIRRDPRDVAVSTLYHAHRVGALPDVTEPAKRRELITLAATRWAEHISLVDRAAPRLGTRLLRLAYEDLHAEPEREIRRLLGHLDGVEATAAMVDQLVTQSRFERASGGRARGEADNQSFFRKGTVGQYRSELTEGEATYVLHAAGQ